MSARTSSHFAADVCHPLPLAALATLLVNDHLLKGAGLLPATVTGKLSDVAGLVLLPILLTTALMAAWGAGGMPQRRRWLVHLSVGATAVGFALLNLSPQVSALANGVWGPSVLDPTDLYALPACAIAWLFLLDRGRCGAGRDAPPLRWHHATVVGIAAFASMATPAPRYPRNFPAWQVVTNSHTTVDCAKLLMWVAKSGKTGIGVAVRVTRASEASCPVIVKTLGLDLRDSPSTAQAGSPPSHPFPLLSANAHSGHTATPTMASGIVPPNAELAAEASVATVYIPVPFDNNTAWNRGRRDGIIELTLTVNGAKHRWAVPVRHRLDGYHRRYGRNRRGQQPALRRAR